MNDQQIADDIYPPSRELTAAERKKVDNETHRRKHLKKGWHAITDWSFTKTNNFVARYYVVWFARKGEDVEATTLVMSTLWRAKVLASIMNNHRAFPCFA